MTNTAYAGQFRNTIMLMNPDGTNRRVVFDDPGKNAIAPVWSPDGRRIAVGLVPFGGGLFAGARSGMPGQVMVMNADGSGVRAVTDERNHLFPSWSPDGRRLVFRSAVGATKRLTILDLETGGQTFLTDGRFTDNFPAWSPKGELILFTSDRDGDWELYTIRSDGTDVKRLTNSPGNDAHATWSHDGEWIAFASARGGFKDEMPIGEGGGQGAGDIFVMRADGSDVRQITDDAFEEATPAFAPTRSRTDQ
jgi:Tol biopolymer transport system component